MSQKMLILVRFPDYVQLTRLTSFPGFSMFRYFCVLYFKKYSVYKTTWYVLFRVLLFVVLPLILVPKQIK